MENKRVPTGKTYEIKNFEQLINVATLENSFDLSMDFVKWMSYCIRIITDAKKSDKKLAKLSNWDVANCIFIWVDDGINDLSKAIIKNGETGEIITVKFDTDNEQKSQTNGCKN